MGIVSVNRNFYNFGIFFIGLFFFLTLFESSLYLQFATQTQYLQSFVPWFAVLNLTLLVALAILLKYYYHKKYRLAFWAVLSFGFLRLCLFIVVYNMLTAKRMEGYYPSIYSTLLLTGIFYGVALVFTKASERRWLMVGGVFLLFINMTLLGIFIWIRNTQDFDLRRTLDTVHSTIAMLGSLLPVPFILNFWSERKALDNEKKNPPLTKITKVVFLVAAIAVLIPTVNLTRDSLAGKFYANTPSYSAKKLAEPFEARTFVNEEGKTLPYRLLRPLDYDPSKKYPLAVCLHHGGGNGIENVIQIQTSEWAQTLADSVNREKYPAFIFVPQCPPGSSFGGIPEYPEMSELVFEAMAELEKEFAIDEKRRYVMGVSLGGFGSWHFIGTRPELFAAALPVCGGGNPDQVENMVDMPIWAFHGEKDKNVPVELSRTMIEGIQKVGGHPKYTEFKNKGHGIWKDVDQTPGVLEWLFKQERE